MHDTPGRTVALDYAEQADWLHRNADRESERYARLAAELTRDGDALLVDVGCGAAGMALALAAARPRARVIALDSEPAVVAMARERAARAGADIETIRCDIEDPAQAEAAIDRPADLIWAGHVVHHFVDQQAAVADLAARLAPGGRLAIVEGGIGARYLPWDLGLGRPGLEHRLIEAGSRRMEAENAERAAVPLPYGWNEVLERAGLPEVRSLHLPVVHPAPLRGDLLDAALAAMTARLGWFADFLSDEDRSTWTALLDPDGPHWVGTRRDLHHLEIQSVYVGVAPEAP
jgi:SAM-dependent methyltransferase